MSTKKRYNLTITISTIQDLVKSAEKIHVDTSVYAIQVAQNLTQFTQINKTLFGTSCTGSFSDSTSDFILFGVGTRGDEDSLQIMTYNCVCSLIGTASNHSMGIIIPRIRNIYTGGYFDMATFTKGVVSGIKDAMKDCNSVVKIGNHTLYFVVPEDAKEAFSLAMEGIE
jgi:hypothetical protein